MMSKAVDWEMVEEDVRRRVYKVKQLKEHNRRLRYLQHAECTMLLASCSDHLRPIVTLALHTGMRRGEILNLKWSQVDIKHRFIFLGAKDTKGGMRREIALNDIALAALASIPRRIDSTWVFVSHRKKKDVAPTVDAKKSFPIVDVKKSFASACKKAGIVDFHFHDLRHTFASHLVMGGQQIAGACLIGYDPALCPPCPGPSFHRRQRVNGTAWQDGLNPFHIFFTKTNKNGLAIIG